MPGPEYNPQAAPRAPFKSSHGAADGNGDVVVYDGGASLSVTIQNAADPVTQPLLYLYLSFSNPATVNDIRLAPGQAQTFERAIPSNPIYGLSSGTSTPFATMKA